MTHVLVEGAKKSKLTLPIIGIFALGFMMFDLGLFLSEYVIVFLVEHIPFLLYYQEQVTLASGGIMVLLFVFLWVKLVERRSIMSLGLRKEKAFKSLGLGLSFGTLLFCMVVFFISLLGYTTITPTVFSLGNSISIMILLFFWIIQASGEEILVRGWGLPSISAKSNIWVGIFLSSLLFVGMHYANTGANILSHINVFLFGVIFAGVTLKYKNIWIAIGFHAAWNFVQSSIFGLYVSGNAASMHRFMTTQIRGDNLMISGGSFGVEASIVTSFIGVVFCVVVLWSLKSSKEI